MSLESEGRGLRKLFGLREPAVLVWRWLVPWKPGIRVLRICSFHLDARAVSKREVIDRIAAPTGRALVLTRAHREDEARACLRHR